MDLLLMIGGMCFVVVDLIVGARRIAPLELAAAGFPLLSFPPPQPASDANWYGQRAGE